MLYTQVTADHWQSNSACLSISFISQILSLHKQLPMLQHGRGNNHVCVKKSHAPQLTTRLRLWHHDSLYPCSWGKPWLSTGQPRFLEDSRIPLDRGHISCCPQRDTGQQGTTNKIKEDQRNKHVSSRQHAPNEQAASKCMLQQLMA